jgi:hypothetical protein
VAVGALALGGCGTSSGVTGVGVVVTNGFGAQDLLASAQPKLRSGETVLAMLERTTRVRSRGTAVVSVDGLAAGAGEQWSYFVNGVGVTTRPARTKLHDRDQVWWDRHAVIATSRIKAVVGSFPDPFLDGIAGKHLPLRIECTAAETKPCNAIQGTFAGLKMAAFEGCLLCSQYNESLRVVVGPWSALGIDPAALELGGGPRVSGVYARFIDGGRRLELLGESGAVVRTVGAGAGLIAATRYNGQPPVWYVTGTDAAGVAAAVQAFNGATLDGHFAIAVVAGAAIPLPTTSP